MITNDTDHDMGQGREIDELMSGVECGGASSSSGTRFCCNRRENNTLGLRKTGREVGDDGRIGRVWIFSDMRMKLNAARGWWRKGRDVCVRLRDRIGARDCDRPDGSSCGSKWGRSRRMRREWDVVSGRA